MKRLVQILALASVAACSSLQLGQGSPPDEGTSFRDPYTDRLFNVAIDPLFYVVAIDAGFAPTGDPLKHSDRARVKVRGPNRFDLELVDAEKAQAVQEGPEWCWAACALMVNRFSGRKGEKVLDSQEDLARYFRGDATSQAANLATIMRAITPDLDQAWQDAMPLEILPERIITQDLLVEDLSRGEMVVVGLDDGSGPHACVALGVVYGKSLLSGQKGVVEASWLTEEWKTYLRRTDKMAENFEFQIECVKIFDPYPGAGVRELSGAEFSAQCRFILSHPLVERLLQLSVDRRKGLIDKGKEAADQWLGKIAK